jgi:hypothetical protein
VPRASPGKGSRLKGTAPGADRNTVIKLLLGLALVGVLGGFTYREANRYQSIEEKLGALASLVARRDVDMRCKSMVKDAVDVSDAHGSVEFDANGRPADVATLRRGVCSTLRRFPKEHTQERYRCLLTGTTCDDHVVAAVKALHAVAHESWHLSGIKDEKIAECYALQITAWFAQRLGAGAAQARAIAAYVAREIYPSLSADYQSGDCTNGGRYDLNRASQSWP